MSNSPRVYVWDPTRCLEQGVDWPLEPWCAIACCGSACRWAREPRCRAVSWPQAYTCRLQVPWCKRCGVSKEGLQKPLRRHCVGAGGAQRVAASSASARHAATFTLILWREKGYELMAKKVLCFCT